MSTIASELTRIENAKSSIITSIENKDVNVPDGAKIDTLSGYIDQISVGITPRGELILNANGTADVTNYASVKVEIPVYNGSVSTL